MKNPFFESSFWNTAFRPFFWFGSLYGILIVGLWLFVLSNVIPNPIQINSIHWHSYEMVFGFTKAIVMGFLFTAVQNWTNTTILKGKSLFYLLTFWLLGRISFYSFGFLGYISFGFDICSDLMVIYLLIPKLIVPAQKHNRPILYHYACFTFFHLMSALSAYSILNPEFTLLFIHLTIYVVLFLILIIGGRVVPFFSGVVIQGYSFKRMAKLESLLLYLPFLFYFVKLLQGSLGISHLIPLDSFSGFHPLGFTIFGFISFLVIFSLFVSNSIRYLSWKPWKSYQRPILWILYVGYLWVCIGFLLYSLSEINLFPVSSAIHSLTVGGIGVFIYGMITRVSLGHTGRTIVASPLTVFAYFLLNLSVLVRVVLPLFQQYKYAYYLSGIGWIICFVLFIVQYTRILFSPRPDGKPS